MSGAHASDHRCLRPIPTTSIDTPALGRTLDDWTVLSHSASHSNHIHIYDAGRLRRLRLPGSTGMVRFNVSNILRVRPTPVLGRTCRRRRQRPSVQGTMYYYYTRVSSRSTTIYSSTYSTTIDCLTRKVGISDLGGASFLMFVEDGETSYTNLRFTWTCIFYVRMAPPW